MTFADVSVVVGKVASVVTRGGKSANRFSVVSVAHGRPTVEAKIIAQRTGVDLTVPANLAAVVLASGGKLFTDGIAVWNLTAETERQRKAKIYRDSSTALRQDYRAAVTEAVEDSLGL